jgi:glycerate 2-kinase
MKNCYIYAHYTFGIGHIQRAALIEEELSSSFKTFLFYSGDYFKKEFKNIHKVIRLPSDSRENRYSKTTVFEKRQSKETILQKRISSIIKQFVINPPDIFITEFFPFAHFRLQDTLIPILDYIKKNYPNCKIICSARDFPISDRESINNYDKVNLRKTIEKYYDLILIHAPKKLSMFDYKNNLIKSIPKIPIKFTGYVVDNKKSKKKPKRNKILITVGGGKDGEIVVKKALKALSESKFKSELEIDVLTGPFSKYSVEYNNPFKKLTIKKYVQNLSRIMGNYSLIFCMSGYNTIAEIMHSKTKAIVFPRPRSYEQFNRVLVLKKYDKHINMVQNSIRINELRKLVDKIMEKNINHSLNSDCFEGVNNSKKEIIRILQEDPLHIIKRVYSEAIDETIKYSKEKLIKDLKSKNLGSKKVFVIGWGKSIDGFVKTMLNNIPSKNLGGCSYVSLNPTRKKEKINRFNATHPILSKKNISATNKIINMLKKAKENDVVIVLSGGGGSSMFEKLKKEISLSKARKIVKIFLKNNADCRLINFTRRICSEVKGGGLLKYIKSKKIITYVISDDVLTIGTKSCVPHVASGPTKVVNTSYKQRMKFIALLKKLGILDLTGKEIFERNNTSHKDNPKELVYKVLCDNGVLLDNISNSLQKIGVKVVKRKEPFFGEVSDLSDKLLNEFKMIENSKSKKPVAYICGGESTVKIKGNGKGGRLQHLIALLAEPISKMNNVLVVGIASDQQDFLKGVAGAYVNTKTFDKVKKIINNSIRKNDTYRLHKKANTLIQPFAANINVGDFIIFLKCNNI